MKPLARRQSRKASYQQKCLLALRGLHKAGARIRRCFGSSELHHPASGGDGGDQFALLIRQAPRIARPELQNNVPGDKPHNREHQNCSLPHTISYSIDPRE